jgi:hypothetical protein
MTAFVEECRREWKRLGVPDLLAEEMATELEADLAEAEADGVSAAEMLGESDPRRFAASWAKERGLVPEQPQPLKSRKRRWVWVAVGLVFLAFFVLFPAFALIGSGSGSGSVSHVEGVLVPSQRRVSVPNVVGMKACKAARTVARSSADGWRIAGFQHGYECDQIVVGQAPVGDVIRRDDHPVIVTLRLGRT